MLTAWIVMAVLGSFFAGAHSFMWASGKYREENPQSKLMIDLFFVAAFLVLIISKVNP